MTESGELGPRKVAVLRAVVEEYVRSGEPVGSETIAEVSGLGVSSATIRNEMAALEELGYLQHPHTSAGRIPTDLGYRRYVDTIARGGKLRETQRRALTAFFAETMLDLEDVLRGTTRLLSHMTQYAAVAAPPDASEERLVRVEVVDLGAALLVLLVGAQGRVDKRMIDRPSDLDGQGVAAIGEQTVALAGLTVSEAHAKILELAGSSVSPAREVLAGVASALSDLHAGEGDAHVVVGGVANLADEAAAWQQETAHRLFEALERESEMFRLLRDVAPQELSVTIGAEHPTTEGWDATLVAAPFGASEAQFGTIGVVGPTRMDYVTVMASVRAVARRLSEIAAALERS
jgi:heat-inducible transcriptional repressor